MVVLSVSILTRSGKVLLARQFVEISRIRLEGLLTAFPKLLSSGNSSSSNTQHTFIDTESVRYVYLPLDSNFYILLLTNKTSNIVEDLQTLQLLSKLIPDVVVAGTGTVLSESSICGKQFELLFALDEVLSAGGHSEHLTLNVLRTNLEMESHEEKLHNMILKSKQDAAKDEMKRQQQRINLEQREKQRLERALGGSVGSSTSSTSFSSSPSTTSSGLSGHGGGYSSTPKSNSTVPSSSTSSLKTNTKKVSGMQLGGGARSKNSNLAQAMAVEDNLTNLPPIAASTTSAASNQDKDISAKSNEPPVVESNDPIFVEIEEKITVQLDKEGAVEQMEVKGGLFVSAKADTEPAQIHLLMNQNKSIIQQYQNHPKTNKKLFDQQGIITLKDPKKGFPESRVGLLRWGLKTQDEDLLPISVTCWPVEESDNKINVTLEYSLPAELELSNVDISIPLGPMSSQPQIVAVDEGEYHHNVQGHSLLWHHNSLSESNNSGSLEFNIRGDDVSVFYPISISFYSKQSYADIQVAKVSENATSNEIQYGLRTVLQSDSYVVQ